jgi:membrane-bound lytic murein transglycosylase B
MIRLGALVFAACMAAAHIQQLPPVAPVAPLPIPFDEWLAGVRREAAERGIRSEVIDQALGNVERVEQVIERDRTQPEFVLDLAAYLKRRLTKQTVRTAQQMYTKHRTLLHRVADQYGVSPRVLVSVWGIESNFGRFSGVRPTISTLATLAYDQRRSALFRTELFSALEILNRGDIEADRLKGSWAGALGQPQFMPSSYLKYAQDFDGDGRRDIWNSQPDVFASVAYYLQQHGWTRGQAWGREIRIPARLRDEASAIPRRETGCRAERIMTEPRPLSAWRTLGFRAMNGGPLPSSSLEASLVQAGARSFLLYSNYSAILEYNCAHTYALSVALLADRIR